MRITLLASAAALVATTVASPYLGLVVLSEDKIIALDSEADCLSPFADAISAKNRLSLNKIATSLQMSLFRDIRQFAPVALALNLTSIQEDILSDDFSKATAGLHSLKTYFDESVPEAQGSETESSSSDLCDAPTAKNLRVVYDSLSKLAQQF
ncbi:hypothetical protein LPJ78_003597 [Coemansia sp. RSA 989]|nr:hypothetical protein BX667DRAFT_508166 [Coemansia mojavensis]KAJ1741585.1 hypothetical protein LPJ68_002714 [Coemansia sp. RSA 1086]KAJ1749843.1 hypothetical protein LPJ79_003408 [Coemansia sp. RSA 1821]KAJ1864128.1 hypothetical protein LPJ78_003597 [Coemansia sp. RSA 989]KAJ1871780.1 hypothetical protein LPJ55_003612 [Coemansia sp. RSA 990]KAJ2668865.1 hypothetical protein IWW42_004923 [Coemansia sp. RSA 1085]